MLETLDRNAVLALARHEEWPAISIYLPAHRAGTERQQDPIRLKNLLKQAEEVLVQRGMRSPEAEALLTPAWALQRDPALLREGFEGLALFVGDQVFRSFSTSRTLPERIRVGDRFLIRPSLTALVPPLRFYVLALSKKRVRLLEGGADEVYEMNPAGIPQGLAEALKYDDYERQVQFHSRTPAAAAGRGRRAAVFHGHGGTADTAKEDLLRYFRQVDRGLRELLGETSAPLLLAGVDYLLPIYKVANTYSQLVPKGVRGNPDEQSAAEIHSEALELLQPYLRRELEDDLAALAEARKSSTASMEVADIITAAHIGRVRSLFVSDDNGAWGSFEPATGEVELHNEPQPEDHDLLDLAASQTLLHGGSVHVMDAEEAIARLGASAAAIFRY